MNDTTQFARDIPDGCTLSIRVQPGARKDIVLGLYADVLKIALSTPPIEGRANEALIAFIAAKLSLPKSRVALLSGPTSRSKVLRVTGRSAGQVKAALLPDVDC